MKTALAIIASIALSGCAANGVMTTINPSTPQSAVDNVRKTFGGVTMEFGSDVYIGNGYYLTAKHTSMIYTTRTGDFIPNDKCDIAIYKATESRDGGIPMARLHELNETVYTIGAPALVGVSSSKGEYKGYYTTINGKDAGCFQYITDATAMSGVSGGAVVNEQGQLVGIVSSVMSGSVTFANNTQVKNPTVFIGLDQVAPWIKTVTGMDVQ